MTRAEVDSSDALFDAFAAWALAHGVSVHGGARRADWTRGEVLVAFDGWLQESTVAAGNGLNSHEGEQADE